MEHPLRDTLIWRPLQHVNKDVDVPLSCLVIPKINYVVNLRRFITASQSHSNAVSNCGIIIRSNTRSRVNFAHRPPEKTPAKFERADSRERQRALFFYIHHWNTESCGDEHTTLPKTKEAHGWMCEKCLSSRIHRLFPIFVEPFQRFRPANARLRE